MAEKADITLESNGQKFGLFLANGVKSIQESSAEESTFNARFSRGKKKFGQDPLLTLSEFRDWTGGRGGKNFEDDETAYADGLAWTLSPGMIVPNPRWQFVTGLRSENRNMPGSMTWKALINTQRYESVSFSASAAYDAAHIWLFVKRVGAPGTLTLDLCPDVGGYPGPASKSVTKTIANITDYIDVFEDFAHATPLTMVTSAIYHIVASGGQSDSGDNHWEVGANRSTPGSKGSADGITWTDESFKLYYRVTAAHVSNKYIFQTYAGGVYATTRPATGTSSFYLFDDVGAFAVAGGTTGLGIVTNRPIIAGNYMYFPQGEAVDIHRWDFATTWDAETGNKATMLQNAYDATIGNQLARANNGTHTSNLSLAPVADTVAHPLVFATAVKCGDGHYPITNTIMHQNKLYVAKEDQLGIVYNGVYSLQESNYKYTPSPRNGSAMCSWNGLLYLSWLNTLMEAYGGTANDVGQNWRGQGPGGNRTGYVSCVLGINAWRFCSIDAGSAGYSSVHVYNGQTWHEIYRAPLAHRIRDLWWQHVDGGHSRLFIDMDYDVVFLEFATDVAKPTNDPTHNYAHSFYVTLSTFDDGAARLAKYIKSLTLSTTNCGTVKDTSVWFEIDYQTDNDVGEDGAEHWYRAGKVYTSPEGTLLLNDGNRRCVRARIRGYTDTSTVPPQVDALTIDGFTRTPARTIWTMKVKTGERSVFKKKASTLLQFLQEAAITADDIEITSIIPELNGRHVISTRPRVSRNILSVLTGSWSGTMTISLMDMSE